MWKTLSLWVVGVPAVLFGTLWLAMFVGGSVSHLTVMHLPDGTAKVSLFAIWESGFLNRITILATGRDDGETWTRVRARDLRCFDTRGWGGRSTGDLGPLTAALVGERLSAAGVSGTAEDLQSDGEHLAALVRAITDRHLEAVTFRETSPIYAEAGPRLTDATIGRFEVVYPRPLVQVTMLPGRAVLTLAAGLFAGFCLLRRVQRSLGGRPSG